MRVVEVTEFGGPEVLVPREAPEPVAGPGKAVIEVALAEILFLDTQLRSGWGREYFDIRPPFVPGAGVAGTVVSVGGGVDPHQVGRRVVAGTSGAGAYNGGGYAERVAVPAEELFDVPEGLDLSAALAALHDGYMAVSRLEKAAVKPGEIVLVGAAGGSIGVWLVPLAHGAGARVIAAARGERKLSHARELGADVAVDYSEAGWPERALDVVGGAGIDVVFDGAGGEAGTAAFEATAQGGRFFSYGAASGGFAKIDPKEAEQRQIAVVGVQERPTPEEKRRGAEQALSEAAAGRVRPTIGETFPLERAADAHAAIEARAVIGKTLLVV